jgi:hypothetical protein
MSHAHGEVRLAAGEIAFAVGVVSTLERALELVRVQLGVADPERARVALAASGQSLVARDLAVQRPQEVRLAEDLRAAAELIAGASWLVRCVRAAGKRTDHLIFHVAPTGIAAQVVESDIVHRVGVIGGVQAMAERACGFFDLAPLEERAQVRIERDTLGDVARLPPGTDIGGALMARGVPREVAAPFAADLAAPRWKGGIAAVECPRGEPARPHTSIALLAGMRTWLLDTRGTQAISLGEASRQRVGECVRAIVRGLDSTVRKLVD